MKIAVGSTVLTLFVRGSMANGEAGGVNTCVRENASQCGVLMRTMMSHTLAVMMATESACECFDFCNGAFVGCSSAKAVFVAAFGKKDKALVVPAAAACDEEGGGEWVRGCTKEDPKKDEDSMVVEVKQERRFLQGTLVGGSTTAASCAVGTFRRGVGAPCVKCLSCAWNARATTSCVTNAADLKQCTCNAGYVTNRRGGCLAVNNGGGGTVVPPPPSVPATSVVVTACAVGTCRTTSTGVCAKSVPCGPNSVPATTTSCVQNANDPNQCRCNNGYRRATLGGVCVAIGGGSVAGGGGTSAGSTSTSSSTSSGGTLVVGPASPSNCPTGTFRRGVGAPCVKCLSCAWNARAITSCVTNAADLKQCKCNAGYVTNNRGGCTRAATTAATTSSSSSSSSSTALESVESAANDDASAAVALAIILAASMAWLA